MPDPLPMIGALVRETQRVTEAIYHVDAVPPFVTPDRELVFLQIGGRVGGAEVPYLLDRLFGVNLYEQWLRALTGTALAIPAKTADPPGGWLTIPKPKAQSRVVSVTSMAAAVPTI
jgi:hypothetical protein